VTEALLATDEREPLDLRAAQVDPDPNRPSPMMLAVSRGGRVAERYRAAEPKGTADRR
jgi:hypothetical protein